MLIWPGFVTRRFCKMTSSRFLSTTHLVVNAVGVDRTGIVSEVTKNVVDAGGNVGESQAAKLGHHFSLMMILQVPSDKLDSFKDTMKKMKDVNTAMFETEAPEQHHTHAAVAYSGAVSLTGADQPGIVHNITSLLARNGLNIQKLKTSEQVAPHGGTTLFEMHCNAEAFEPLAKEFDADKIRSQLEDLGDSLNCDISLEDGNT